MYSSAISLKDLMLKFGHQAYLYHQVMAYDHVIAYYRTSFVVIDMEVMINYLSATKIWHAKRHLDVMRCVVHSRGYSILYFMIPHFAFIVLSIFYLYYSVGRSTIPQSC